jgi:hypothetical protein
LSELEEIGRPVCSDAFYVGLDHVSTISELSVAQKTEDHQENTAKAVFIVHDEVIEYSKPLLVVVNKTHF